MPIPRKSVPIQLKAAEPTELTPAVLQKQLHDIGLNCKLTKEPLLEQFIQEVNADIPDGMIKAYSILKPAKDGTAAIKEMEGDWTQSSVGNWEPDSTAIGYATDLEYLIYPQHFDWLRDNYPGFPGNLDSQQRVQRYDSVDSIKTAFIDVSLSVSSALIKGLNKDALNSVFSDFIEPLDDQKARDYDKTDDRVIFLVENYDPNTGYADAVGALLVRWHLLIKDYKEKKKAIMYDTKLEVWSRVVLYSDIQAMEAAVNAAKAHFKGQSFDGAGYIENGIPVKDTTIKIYDKRPPASAETFRKSLPLIATSKNARVIVLYAPDLQNHGSIDNTKSKASSTYAKSVSTGFSFSSTQGIKISAEFEAGIVLAKGKFSTEFSISFTEQYSKMTNETISFTVPAGEMAFTYQGTLRSQILEYDPGDDTYKYTGASRFLSPIMATTAEPIASDAKPEIVR